MFIQILICVLLTIFAAEDDIVRISSENSLLTSFAINITVLIARIQTHVSPRNAASGLILGIGLTGAGTYGLAIRYRYPQSPHDNKLSIYRRVTLIIIWVVSFTTGALSTVLMFWILRRWRFSPPHPCNGNPEIPLPEPKAAIPLLFLFVVWVLALLFALIPRKKMIWRILSVVCICIWLIGVCVQSEVWLRLFPGYDPQFLSQASQWSLGQIITIILALQQILEIARYYQERKDMNQPAFRRFYT